MTGETARQASPDDGLPTTSTLATPSTLAKSSYLLALGAGAGLILLTLFGLMAGAERAGRLPPPAFSNSLCEDEKLMVLRDRHASDAPTLLAVGSSVSWRHFDAAALTRAMPQARPLNAGFCGLKITQTAYVLDWLLRRYPSARQVLAIVAPQDFESCTRPDVPVFDTAVADELFENRVSLWSYYIRYFSFSFLTNQFRIKEGREARPGFEPLFHDKYGAAPIDPFSPHPFSGLFYRSLTELDTVCFAALRKMASVLTESGRRFVVATTPLHPEWVDLDRQHGGLAQTFSGRLEAALAGTGATFWDGNREMGFAGREFTDAIHLRWAAASRFSEALIERTRLGISSNDVGVLNASQTVQPER
jgi:hypothetical protein